MDKPKEFIKSSSLVVNEVSNSGFKMECQPNVNNEREAFSFTVYKGVTKVKITVKRNGTIRMKFDREGNEHKDFTKTPSKLKSSKCFAIKYGYKQRKSFPVDFKLI